MLSFASDYTEGCHESILKALTETNLVQQAGYGSDDYTESAIRRIRAACGRPEAQVYLIGGGTQTNQLVIDTMLAPYEGVIAADTGHVAVHEAGAIEFTGHKVLTLPGHQGKLNPKEVEAFIRSFYEDGNHEHMVFPGMVYLSHPTEYGTLYTADELRALSRICREYKIPLYMDGARLGYGLQAEGTDVTLPLIAELVDAFYLGGTKVGALLGEALVFPGDMAPSHFLTQVKQHGALLAKGRVLGLQFDTLFTDGLYEKLGRHGILMAQKVKEAFLEAGYSLFLDSPTNQQFILLDNQRMEALASQVGFSFWEKADETHSVVRFATSWATTAESVEALRRILQVCGGER